jgi:hypothetical protein
MKIQAIALLSCALLCGAALHAEDTEPPVIASIAISPDPVEVSSGPQSITVTLEITDNEDGFAQGFLYLRSGDDDFIDSFAFGFGNLTSGDAQSGTYDVSVEVPGYGSPGTWRFEAYVRDSGFNSITYGTDPADEPFPVPADATFTVTNSGTPDTVGPVASNIVFSPLSVSTAAGAATITVNFDATDSPSGYDYGFIYRQDPNGDYLYDGLIEINASNRLSGDAFSGSYEGTATIPQGSLTGPWKVELVMRDKLGNYSFSPQTEIQVTGAAGTLRNALDAVQYDWSTSTPGWKHQSLMTHDGVDAAASEPIGDDETATFETTVTGPGTLSFHWKVDSEASADYLSVDVSGTSLSAAISGDVDWQEVVLTIPEGEHTVIWAYSKNSSGSEGADRGWVDAVRFIADSDNEGPVLQSVRISPNFVNISQGSQSVTAQIEASDDLNGISEGYVYLIDPYGNTYDNFYFDSSALVSGDSNYGTYEVYFDIYDYFDTGIWRIEIELEEDFTSSTVYYGPSDEPFPNPGEEFLTVSDTGGGSEAPLVEEISVTPGVVDVSSGSQDILVTLRITDPDDGFSYGSIELNGPSGQGLSTYFWSGHEVSGDAFDGVYQVTVTVPLHAEPGTWTLGVNVTDSSENTRSYPYDPPFDLPGDDSVTVVNTGSIDTQAPVVSTFQVSANAVDPSGGPVPVTVDVSIVDSLSGLEEGYFYLYTPSGNYHPGSLVSLGSGNRTSGDALSGTYQVTLTFPAGAVNGVWTVRSYLRDATGNYVLYGFSGPPMPGPGSAQITVGPVTDSTFATFASAYSLSGINALPGGNPDSDWANNALELLLGLDPTVSDPPDPALYKVTRVGNELQLDFKISAALSVTVDGDYLNVSSAGAPPFKLTGQTHSTLSGIWTNTLPVAQGGGVYRVSLPIGPGDTGFCRLMFHASSMKPSSFRMRVGWRILRSDLADSG